MSAGERYDFAMHILLLGGIAIEVLLGVGWLLYALDRCKKRKGRR